MNDNITLPEKVSAIIKKIQISGFEAYAVGGCVRDSLLGREPEDWDITTSASPEEVKALFDRTFDTGIEHGTVTVLQGKEGFEVTTYRIDGEYEDNRHPKEISFTRELKEDLQRRDFTINAMAYNEQAGLIDIFGGVCDLEKGIVCCVGEATQRFAEDALRILRAIRFAAQLGFAIEEKTKEAIADKAFTLSHISSERIQVELVKIITSPNPDMLRLAYELGVTAAFLPEFDVMMQTKQQSVHHRNTVGEHTLEAVKAIEPQKILRLAMLLHDVGKPVVKTIDGKGEAHFLGHEEKGMALAKSIMMRLKFDNDTLKKVITLVQYHDCRIPPTMKSVRRLMNKMGAQMFPLYLAVRRADMTAQSDYQKSKKIKMLEETIVCFQQVVMQNQCTSLKQLAVCGADLIEIGMKPGKDLGEMLNFLLQKVIDKPELNNKSILLQLVKDKITD